MKDIESRDDIALLINTFYDKVKEDDTIGYIFNDVANVNWEKHLPVMYDFWETTLFHKNSYQGNPMGVHQKLNKDVKLSKAHFARWEKLFHENADALFKGLNTETIKQRATSIKTVMELKIVYSS